MTTPSLDPNDARLTDYALGELDDASRAEVEQLLAASPELRSELAIIRNLADGLRAELAVEASPALTAEQRQAVQTHLVASERTTPTAVATKPQQRRSQRRWLVAGAEATAALLFLVLVWPFLPLTSHSDDPRHGSSEMSQTDRPTIAMPRYGDSNTDLTPFSSVLDSKAASVTTSVTPGPQQLPSDQPMGIRATSGAPAESDEMLEQSKGDLANSIRDGVTATSESAPSSTPFDLNRESRLAEPQNSRGVVALGEANTKKEATPHPGPISRFGRNNPAPTDVSSLQSRSDRLAGKPLDAFIVGEQRSDRDQITSLARSDDSSRGTKYFFRPGEGKPFYGQPDPQTNETYEAPAENVFLTPGQQPLSTFSIDVDSASYANVRRFLTQGQLPPADAVRIEEMINYFTYDYPQPKEGEPFSVTADAAPCPWQREHYLARIALKARTIDKAKRPPTNLVFLLDVSGSMQAANKLPLVKQAMTMLAEELNERDRIAIVTYAGNAGVKLASTPGNDQVQIMQAIEALQAGGSTNGAAGINLAYEQALHNFNREGENRVILCTDGDFNVGVSSDEQLVQMIQQQAKSKVFLSIFGFGMGNLKDAKLEKLADKGNGHYGYIDDLKEARRVFNEELVGTLYTVAKDVKIQVEFNPLTVGAYRLIGYENRALAARDFNDDTKDAGEIGAGHTVTALYEIVPRAQWPKTQAVDPLKYGNAAKEPAPPVVPANPDIPADVADDLFTVKLRYKQPTADTSVKTIDYAVDDIAGKNVVPSTDFQWAAAVAAFGMQLKHSQFAGQWALNDVLETAQGAKGSDTNGRRREFLDLVQAARRLNP